MKVSACLITRNEEKNLARCLSSLPRNIDEIVIVDGVSKDKTVAIAKRFKARVVQRKFSGSYSDERNYCMSLAKNNWILSIDADEVLTPELRRYVEKLIRTTPTHAMHCVPRKTIRKGKFIKEYYSYPGFKPFVFDRIRCHFTGRVHEMLVVNGKRKFIPHHLLHIKDSFKNTGPMQVRYNRLSEKTKYVLDIPITKRVTNVWFTFRSMFFGLGFYKSLEGWRYTFGYIRYLFRKYRKEKERKV
jgi:glycosyltransferase involved in cell wall biosynthesis